jgi:hypothetical protein
MECASASGSTEEAWAIREGERLNEINTGLRRRVLAIQAATMEGLMLKVAMFEECNCPEVTDRDIELTAFHHPDNQTIAMATAINLVNLQSIANNPA